MCIVVRTACIDKYCFMHSNILKIMLVYVHWDMWFCFHFFFFFFLHMFLSQVIKRCIWERDTYTRWCQSPFIGEWLMLSLSLKYVVIFTFFPCNKILNLEYCRPCGKLTTTCSVSVSVLKENFNYTHIFPQSNLVCKALTHLTIFTHEC